MSVPKDACTHASKVTKDLHITTTWIWDNERLCTAHSTGKLHTHIHVLVWWIMPSGIAENFYRHDFGMFTITHRRWIRQQLCRLSPASASRTCRPSPTVMQAVFVTYFVKTDVFQLLDNFCNVWLCPFLGCFFFFGKSFSGHLGPTSTGDCLSERKAVISKRHVNLLLLVFRNNASYYCLNSELPFLGRWMPYVDF